MAAGLRSLNTYVPKTLFRKLMRLGVEEAARSREVELTIVFTDIAGFTRQSEGMSAGEAADFLNRHFAMLVAAVEEENGTVDKFMGDGMLAFWGAPDARDDHAEAAVRAAGAIKLAQEAANRAASSPAAWTRIRIGIHTGPVIVGNIGAFDRVDYTIVGDAVNVSQRLQELGRSVAGGDEMVILASASTVERLDCPFPGCIRAATVFAVARRGRCLAAILGRYRNGCRSGKSVIFITRCSRCPFNCGNGVVYVISAFSSCGPSYNDGPQMR